MTNCYLLQRLCGQFGKSWPKKVNIYFCWLDYILTVESKCPLYDKLSAELEQSKEIKDMIKDNQQLFDYLSLHSGSNVSRIVDLEYIYDVLFIEVKHMFMIVS